MGAEGMKADILPQSESEKQSRCNRKETGRFSSDGKKKQIVSPIAPIDPPNHQTSFHNAVISDNDKIVVPCALRVKQVPLLHVLLQLELTDPF